MSLAAACVSPGIGESDPFARGGGGQPVETASSPGGDSIRLSGTVSTTEADGEALAGVLVTLVTPGGSERAAARSDSAGGFDLGVVAAGAYSARARAPGHAPLETRVEVRGLPPVRLVILLAPDGDPDARSSAEILARRDPLEVVGFHERRARESGSFLAGDEVHRRSAPYPSELVVSFPGFRLAPLGRGVAVVGRRGCPPNLFIDGMHVGDTRQLDLLVSMASVAAIEAYPGSTPPAEFAGLGSGCGAVVIWTPRGG